MKVTFLCGASLDPVPPVGSKDPNARHLHVSEDGALDEERFVDWVRQAARLPGWEGF